MSPELKAFKYYQKNLDKYPLDDIVFSHEDAFDRLMDMYRSITDRFGADIDKFIKILEIRYNRQVNKSLK